MKVLVVDDSMTIRMQVRNALKGAGFDVVEARDGLEGLRTLSADISAIVCDVNMPQMNGIEFLENIPAEFKHVPFLMLTTEGQATLMQRARDNGAKGWLVKPFKPDLLIAALRKLTAS